MSESTNPFKGIASLNSIEVRAIPTDDDWWFVWSGLTAVDVDRLDPDLRKSLVDDAIARAKAEQVDFTNRQTRFLPYPGSFVFGGPNVGRFTIEQMDQIRQIVREELHEILKPIKFQGMSLAEFDALLGRKTPEVSNDNDS